MYAILRNTVLEAEAKSRTKKDLEGISHELIDSGYHIPFGFDPQDRLAQALAEASDAVIGNETDLAKNLHEAILRKCSRRPKMFQEVPLEYTEAGEARTTMVASLLNWFCSTVLERTFFDVNVDASLTEEDFVESFLPIKMAAQKLLGSEAVVVVFLDGKLPDSLLLFHLKIHISSHLHLYFPTFH